MGSQRVRPDWATKHSLGLWPHPRVTFSLFFLDLFALTHFASLFAIIIIIINQHYPNTCRLQPMSPLERGSGGWGEKEQKKATWRGREGIWTSNGRTRGICIFLDKDVEPRKSAVGGRLPILGQLEVLSITTPLPRTRTEVKLLSATLPSYL